jgi:hypothetical protein
MVTKSTAYLLAIFEKWSELKLECCERQVSLDGKCAKKAQFKTEENRVSMPID